MPASCASWLSGGADTAIVIPAGRAPALLPMRRPFASAQTTSIVAWSGIVWSYGVSAVNVAL